MKELLFMVVGSMLLIAIIFGACLAYPHYEVYAQRKAGEAEGAAND